MLKAEYLARGSRCNRRFVGNSQPRYPLSRMSPLSLKWKEENLLTKVEQTRQPLIVVANKLEVVFQTHDARVRQCGFYQRSDAASGSSRKVSITIKVVEAVNNTHELRYVCN